MWLFSRNGRKETNPPNVMIFVDSTRSMCVRRVRKALIPKGSLARNYRGLNLHYINVDLKGKVRPITIPDWPAKPAEGNISAATPKDLWLALNCEQEVNETYSLSDSLLHKLSYIAFYVLIGAELFILFLIAASQMGGIPQ